MKLNRTIEKGAALVLAALLLAPQFSLASPEDDRASYEEQAAEKLKESNAIQGKLDSISEEKRQIDEEADAAIAEHKARRAELLETQSRMEENEARIKTLQTDYDKQSTRLGERVRDIYINGQISYLDVLFGAKDFQDLMTRMDLLKRIIKQDYDLVQVVIAEKDEIEDKQKALANDRDKQAAQEKKARLAREDMEAKVRKRQAIIDKLKTDKATIDRQYDELVAASKQITQMLQASRIANAPISGSGAMIWPVNGSVTSGFGWRVHPITGTRRFHSGVDIGGDYGQEIHAAQSGTVEFAGWISGYGNAVIINHGGGISSLYGHCQSVAVSVGQSVSQGETIAYVGSTGNSTGPHCHFEVRQNGEPVNPYNYL